MNSEVLQSGFVLTLVAFLWPLAVKYWKPLAKIPNDVIPWVNGLLFLLNTAAGAVPATVGVVAALTLGRFAGAIPVAFSVGAVFVVATLVLPVQAQAGGFFGAIAGLAAKPFNAMVSSGMLGLLYKVYAQPLLEKRLGLVNWEKMR